MGGGIEPAGPAVAPMSPATPLPMLFIRDFRGFQGGHLKLRDYITHTAASGWVQPQLYLTPDSFDTPELDDCFGPDLCPRVPDLAPAEAYFLAGLDWYQLDQAGIDPTPRPVLNLIQHVRHADPGTALFACLRRPATRLCVSQAVADAIAPHANGSVVVMPTAVNIPALPPRAAEPGRVLVAGLKAPGLAQQTAALLAADIGVDLVTDYLPRTQFLQLVGRAQLTVLLPHDREGFFLPALEAMALGRAVVTTDSLGSRDFCRHGENCLIAPRDATALATSIRMLLANPALRQTLERNGPLTAAARNMHTERQHYWTVLASLAPD